VALAASTAAAVDCRCGLCVLGEYQPFPQYTRLNLPTAYPRELHRRARAISCLAYDVVGVTPISDEVCRLARSASDVDVITIDAARCVPDHRLCRALARTVRAPDKEDEG